MYRPITMYQIVCDRYGEVFGGTDTCSALFSNKELDIGDYSDWEMIDGKHYCPNTLTSSSSTATERIAHELRRR